MPTRLPLKIGKVPTPLTKEEREAIAAYKGPIKKCPPHAFTEHLDNPVWKKKIIKQCRRCTKEFRLTSVGQLYCEECKDTPEQQAHARTTSDKRYYNHTCKTCGKIFNTDRKDRKYCSLSCAGKAQKKTYVLTCETCGTKFTGKRRYAKYCSDFCRVSAKNSRYYGRKQS